MDNIILVRELSTDFIYEAQLFDDFVLVRHASPSLRAWMERLDWPTYNERFGEFTGRQYQDDKTVTITGDTE